MRGIKGGNLKLEKTIQFFIGSLVVLCASAAYGNLAAHWRLDGDAQDVSGNNHHGTVYGGTWHTTEWIDGAIEFDGVDDYIEIADFQGITGTTGRSCLAWIKTSDTSSLNDIVGWGTPETGRGWLISLVPGGYVYAGVYNGYRQSKNSVSDGKWHHIAIVLADDGSPNAAEIKIYIDGREELSYTTQACAVDTSADRNVQIGLYTHGDITTRSFQGLIDDMRIYDQALSAEEIRVLAASFAGGNGTEGSPYQISEPRQLISLGKIKGLLSKHYILTNNIVFDPVNNPDHVFNGALIAPYFYVIDFSSTPPPPPPPFNGVFDGNGFKVINLSIEISDFDPSNDYWVGTVGLFGYVSSNALIENLGIENVTLLDNSHYYLAGALAGWSDGTVTNCYSSGSIIGGDAGGVVGLNRGVISNCYSTAAVNGLDAGGLVGRNSESESLTGQVRNCYSKGNVSAYSIRYSRVGGFVGYNSGYITKCYSTGAVSGGIDTAGFAADGYGWIFNSFWDVESSGTYNWSSPGISGKTTAEMKTISTFSSAGWDFTTTDGDPADWSMPPGDYPQLTWERTVNFSGQTTIALQPDENASIQLELYMVFADSRQWTISGQESCAWITSVEPSSGSLSGPADRTRVTILVDTAGMSYGEYEHQLTITADDGDVTPIAVLLQVHNRVDVEELLEAARHWLETGCDYTRSCYASDWYIDSIIDLTDLSALAKHWQGTMPITSHWPLDGNAADRGGRARDGVVHGSPAWSTEGQNGAIELDGIDDYIEITGYTGIVGTLSRSCSAWFKASNLTQNGVILSWGSQTAGAQWLIGILTTGEAALYSNGPMTKTVNPYADDQWHHVTVMMAHGQYANLNQVRIYIDGVWVTATPSDQPLDSVCDGNVLIGAFFDHGQPSNFFKGLLDDVRIYDRILSPGEIQSIIHEGD